MNPKLLGPKPIAIVLCAFKDLPGGPFLGEAQEWLRVGSGGLQDYWNGVSGGLVSLEGSRVFGWFTMQYSVADIATKKLGRSDFWAEARRLAASNGVDLSAFFTLVSIVNHPSDSGSVSGSLDYGGNLAMFRRTGQNNWRWCRNCRGLAFAGGKPGICPANKGPHDHGQTMYVVARNVALPGAQAGWRWCRNCQGLTFDRGSPNPETRGHCPAGEFHDHRGSAAYVVSVTNAQDTERQINWKRCNKCQWLTFDGSGPRPEDRGRCPADDGFHDHTGSAMYGLFMNQGLSLGFAAHELGHAFGLDHSFNQYITPNDPGNDSRSGAYGDPSDIMSYGRTFNFTPTNVEFAPAGPGLNAPTLDKLGWIPKNRQRIVLAPLPKQPNITTTVNLAALTRPESSRDLMLKVVKPYGIYTAELRLPTNRDQGFPNAGGVYVHFLRSHYTFGQDGWRRCRNCRGLVFAGNAVCPAGGTHSQRKSGNYAIAPTSAGHGGQPGWRWCAKCQTLAWSGDGIIGICPAGDQHDHSASTDYALRQNSSTGHGQSGWRFCSRCRGLYFAAGNARGICPAGGFHATAANSDYRVEFEPNSGTQPQWRWCVKCQGIWFAGSGRCSQGGTHDVSDSSYYSLNSRDHAPGQKGWHWCQKCFQLVFDDGAANGCAQGGRHDLSQSSNYALRREDEANGELNWRWCANCHGLYYSDGTAIPLDCPQGGLHDFSKSSHYVLAEFRADRTYWIDPALDQGTLFQSRDGSVRINVMAIDRVAGTARLELLVTP